MPTAENDAPLSERRTYLVKEVPTWHGRQDTPRSATTVATNAPTSAGVPPSIPANTCATGTRLGDKDAGPIWPRMVAGAQAALAASRRVIPPGKRDTPCS